MSFLTEEDFADIVNFNTPAMINAIGVATSDIAEMGVTGNLTVYPKCANGGKRPESHLCTKNAGSV